MNDFKKDLEYSLNAKDEKFWQQVYQKAFPNLDRIESVERPDLQKIGIDRIVYLKNGNSLRVDEKKRRKVYKDILLEYISADTNNSPGWIEKDLAIDYIAYAFMPIKTVYFFPFPLLRKAWFHHKEEWLKIYPTIKAVNRTYTTKSIAIPLVVLKKAIIEAMVIKI